MRLRVRLFFLTVLGVMLTAGPQVFAQTLDIGGSLKHFSAASLEGGRIPLSWQNLDLLVKGSHEFSSLVLNPWVTLNGNQEIAWGIREAYLDFFTPLGDLRVGKQALSWGQAEGVFITDIVSPQDLSSFILADFREIRKGVTSVKASHYLGEFTLEGVWVPWFEPATLPGPGSLWRTAGMPDLSLSVLPDRTWENSEVFGRLGYFGSGINGEVMGAWAWDDLPVASGLPAAPVLEYRRYGVTGGSLSSLLGPLVLRLEGAVYFNKSFTALILGMPPQLQLLEKNQYQGSAGLDFSFFGWDLSGQYIAQWVQAHEASMKTPELAQTVTFRARESFWDETLKVGFFGYFGLDPYDALLRPSVSWVPEDGLEIELRGEIFLGDEKGRFGVYDTKDLITLGIRWYF